ncbi:Tautomerase/MIF [Cucurbitaria berberidis CBS 394.84]|uniref:L-dopachrome isomerase n=1 Tax=Cucurbitaria berberidis CBS 394.84 TaxID=1168544 RepID=A0A9P4L7N2_9PLEO|nr:Tautomerase/MIF [Cucurbitaria berberidis CBS 394.84]KAF1844283.1 Tautomerase/MIF [Cucurbitaria berberidis CBS 394.84]
MSRPSSTSTYSGNVFPKQAGVTLLSPETVGDQLSPSASQFSFASSPHSVQDADQDDSRQMRSITRGTTGDKIGQLRPLNSRSRQQFYDDSFSCKESAPSSARDRVTKDAPIVADLRTNVIIKDEYTLVTDLSHHLSTRYQRPESSIMITVNHSACLLLGGSFEPTYILTINALPVQVQPTTNKRNAALIQTFMTESIGVSPDRGIIKFVAIAEENMAMNGMTILGEIERLERQQAEATGSNIKRAMTKSSRKSAISKAKSSIQLARNDSKADPRQRTGVAAPIPSDGSLDSAIAINEKGLGHSASVKPVDTKINSKTSEPLLSKFSMRSNSNAQVAPPPIPADKPTVPAIGKRKSFLSVFRR